jgi:hypothetical protein
MCDEARIFLKQNSNKQFARTFGYTLLADILRLFTIVCPIGWFVNEILMAEKGKWRLF